MKFFSKKMVFLLLGLIFILGIVSPLTLFEGNKILIGLDEATPLRPSFRLKGWFYTWAGYSGLGRDVSSRVVNLPTQVLPFVLMEKLGLSLVASQKIFFIAIFLISGFSMFFLSLTIWENEYLLAFFASILYMFNPVVGGYWASFLIPAIWCLAVSPLLLGIFIKGIKSRNKVRYAIFLSWASLLYPAVSPPLYVMLLFAFIVFGGYFFIVSNNKKQVLVFVFLSLVLTLLLNAWWMINIIRMFFQLPEFLESGDSGQRLLVSSLTASFLNLFRFQTNYWGYSYWGDKVNNWVGFLYETKPVLIFSSFIFSFLAFASLLWPKKNNLVKILCFFSLLFIFLSKGLHSPFEDVFGIFLRLPLFNMFRTPAHKFPVLTFFLFPLIIAWLINQIFLRFFSRYKKRSILFLFLTLIVLLSSQWYFFTGDAVQRGKSAQPSILVEFPKYYWEAADWLKKENGSSRILLLPGSNIPTLWQIYKWGFLGLYYVPSDIFEKPTVDKLPEESSDLVRWGIYANLGDYSNLPEDFLQIRPTDELYKILDSVNIKYILINHDIDWQHIYYGSENPNILENNLIEQKNIVFEKSFETLHFFKVTSDQPKFYASVQSQSIYGNRLGINQLLPFLNSRDVIFLDEQGSLNSKDFVFANMVNPITNEELTLSDSSKAVNFPYVRWSPRSFFYQIMRAKEDSTLNRISDPNTRGLFLLNLAAKRISEVEKWQNDFSLQDWNQMIESYNKNMLETISIIEKKENKSDQNFLSNKLKISFKAHEAKLFLILKDNPKKNEIISNFLNKTETAAINFFDTGQNSKIVYSLKIPLEGKYNIFLHNDNFVNDCEGKCLGKLDFNGNNKESSLRFTKKGWINLGTANFQKGESNFDFKLPSQKNKLSNIKWQEVTRSEAERLLGQSNREVYFFSQTVEKIYPNSIYDFKFDYQFDGEKIGVIVSEVLSDGSERTLFNKELISGKENKRLLNEMIRSGFNTKKLKIYLYYSSNQKPEKVVSDFQVKRILEPLVVLISDNREIGNLIQPEIDYQKINATKFVVKIKNAKNPFILTFLESFSPDWKAKIMGKTLSEDKHKITNGYANSWLINQNGSQYEVEIEYLPQKYFYWGIAISSFSALICLLYLIFNLSKKLIK